MEPSASPSFPREVIEAFVGATVAAFQELTDTVVERIPFAEARTPNTDVYATIVLRHEPPGRMILSFPVATLESLAGRYLAGAAALTPELVDDAAGEFANVIAGQAKTMLKGTPDHFLLSTPLVVRERDSRSGPERESTAILHFECDAGNFRLEIVHW